MRTLSGRGLPSQTTLPQDGAGSTDIPAFVDGPRKHPRMSNEREPEVAPLLRIACRFRSACHGDSAMFVLGTPGLKPPTRNLGVSHGWGVSVSAKRLL